MKPGYVYTIASRRNGTLYIGVTSDLVKRLHQHRTGQIEGFTKKYRLHKLVYYEYSEDIRDTLVREKQLKAWQRKWKLELIEKHNPNWGDLFDSLI